MKKSDINPYRNTPNIENSVRYSQIYPEAEYENGYDMKTGKRLISDVATK